MGGLFNKQAQRHRLLSNFVFCVIHLSVMIALMVIQPPIWIARTFATIVPDDSRVLLDSPSGKPIQGDLRALFLGFVQQYATVLGYNFANLQQLHLLLTGLNVWSLLGFACMLGSSVVTAWLNGHTGLLFFYWLAPLILCVVCFGSMGLLLERVQRQRFQAEVLLVQQMYATQTAEDIVNHTLRNILADVSANIELYVAGTASMDALQDAIESLQRGMRACKERQVYLKLLAGEYSPVLTALNLRDFGQQLVEGRNMRGEFVDAVVLQDSTLCRLVLQGAAAYALKHGRQDDPDVVVAIHQLPCPSLMPNTIRLEFMVSCAANPDSLALPLLGIAREFNCYQVPPLAVPQMALLGDLGLASVGRAARAGGMSLSVVHEGGRLVFRAQLNAQQLPNEAAEPPRHLGPTTAVQWPAVPNPASDAAFPQRLRFFVLDDALASRRLMEHHILRSCPTAVVRTFGELESDVELFPALAVGEADIVVVDQHLEYRECYLGTVIVQRLLALGYRGFICMRSADDSAADQAKYMAAGAHCSFGKDVPGRIMMEQLSRAFAQFRQGEGCGIPGNVSVQSISYPQTA